MRHLFTCITALSLILVPYSGKLVVKNNKCCWLEPITNRRPQSTYTPQVSDRLRGGTILSPGLLSRLPGFVYFTATKSLAAETPLLPESLAARSEIAPIEKTFTVFLEEDDPVKLAALLNSSNEEYAQKGWSVFTITAYTHNGDMDGFFVTYCKGLTVE